MARPIQEVVAECQRLGLGMSACLDRISAAGSCSPDPVRAHFPNETDVVFSCGSIPSPEKSAVLLKEAVARAHAEDGVSPWLVVGGVAVAGGLAWWWLRRA